MKVPNGIDIEKLYQTYYMDVYSYIMTIMKDRTAAEELTQETFFRAMKSHFKEQSSEMTWLCAIAKNLCMDVFRKKKCQVPAEEEIESGIDVEHTVVSRAQNLEIHLALHQLEEPYKEVFSLRVFGELSFREIGQIFDKTENWARVTYHRGKMKLQERIEKGEKRNEISM